MRNASHKPDARPSLRKPRIIFHIATRQHPVRRENSLGNEFSLSRLLGEERPRGDLGPQARRGVALGNTSEPMKRLFQFKDSW